MAIVCVIVLIFVIHELIEFLGFTAIRHNPLQNIFYTQLAAILSSVTLVLLTYLLAKYFEIYLSTKSKFTLGLILMILAMLADSITSNPLVHQSAGFAPLEGPFVFIPLIFTFLTAVALLYLVHK